MAGPCLMASGPHGACPRPPAHGTCWPFGLRVSAGEASFIRLEDRGGERGASGKAKGGE